MPLVPLLVGYGVGAGATFLLLMQPYDLADRPSARCKWAAVAILGALLWPLTWIALYLVPIFWASRGL